VRPKLIRSEHTGKFYTERSWQIQIEKCQAKRKFKNIKIAKASTNAIKRLGSGRLLYPYKCPVCGKLHLTRNKKEDLGKDIDTTRMLVEDIVNKIFNVNLKD
jgi:hypothetical protein